MTFQVCLTGKPKMSSCGFDSVCHSLPEPEQTGLEMMPRPLQRNQDASFLIDKQSTTLSTWQYDNTAESERGPQLSTQEPYTAPLGRMTAANCFAFNNNRPTRVYDKCVFHFTEEHLRATALYIWFTYSQSITGQHRFHNVGPSAGGHKLRTESDRCTVVVSRFQLL